MGKTNSKDVATDQTLKGFKNMGSEPKKTMWFVVVADRDVS